MAQSKSVRLVTEAALDTSQTKVLAPIRGDIADLKVLGGLNPGSPNDASTSNFIETPGTLTHTALSTAFVGAFLPERFGAKGDGSTNDTTALQACLDAASTAADLENAAQTVWLSGKYYVPGGVVWTTPQTFGTVNYECPGANITGPGIIAGTLTVGTGTRPTGYLRYNLRIEVDFALATKSATVDAITVQHAYHVTVAGSLFTNYRAAIARGNNELGGTNQVDVGDLRIDDITLANCDYGLYAPAPRPASGAYGIGDVKISNSRLRALISSVRAHGIDGLSLVGCYLYGETGHDVEIVNGTEIVSTGSFYFASGKDGLHLEQVTTFAVSGNSFAQIGDLEWGSAIYINGGANGTALVEGAIGTNVFHYTSGSAIVVDGVSTNVVIAPQQMVGIGSWPGPTGTQPVVNAVFAGPNTDEIHVYGVRSRLGINSGARKVVLSGTNSRNLDTRIDSLTPWTIQVLGLTPSLSQINTWVPSQSSAAYFGGGMVQSASPSIGDCLIWGTPISAGIWRLRSFIRSGPANAQIDIGISYDSGLTWSSIHVVDSYASAISNAIGGATTFTVPLDTTAQIRALVTGKNGTSTDYFANIQALLLSRMS